MLCFPECSIGWCARHTTRDPWVQVDFGAEVDVTGLQYGAGPIWDTNTDDFVVSYGDDGKNWARVQNEAKTGDALVS